MAYLRGISLIAASLFVTSPCIAAVDGSSRPNIVWIVVEDMSANFGCYGEQHIATPNVDQLASEGVQFTNAVITAPVCSAARSALITGMYQTSIGAHHHRSGRGELRISLPDQVRTAPELFRNAGYLTLNLTFDNFVASGDAAEKRMPTAKTDYNFQYGKDLYDRVHWSQREADQPFFAQVQLRGGKLRGTGDGDRWPRRVEETLGSVTSPDAEQLPPYLPADPVILRDWAQYLDAVRYTDWEVGRIVERLRKAGELGRTYIFFITDHGISHVRNKQFCYEGGVHIPLIVRGPEIAAGSVRTDVIQHIDLLATSLGLAEIPIPNRMQARDILADDYAPRTYAFAARDRCDETVDRIRCVRSERFKYIRNFYPQRPYLQPNRYKDDKPIVQAMRRLHAEGGLSPIQAQIMAETRPAEELYDLTADPHELSNLADDPDYRDALTAMREALDDWIERTDDKGRLPEGAMYDSDMVVYAGKGAAQTQEESRRRTTLLRNIAQMKQWDAEGK